MTFNSHESFVSAGCVNNRLLTTSQKTKAELKGEQMLNLHSSNSQRHDSDKLKLMLSAKCVNINAMTTKMSVLYLQLVQLTQV